VISFQVIKGPLPQCAWACSPLLRILMGHAWPFRAAKVLKAQVDARSSQARCSNRRRHVTWTVLPAQLPDGTEIQVGPDRFAVPEVLFNPVRPCLC